MSVFLQPIYTQTVGSGGAASISFNNIPQGFTDLKLVASVRSLSAAQTDQIAFILNASTPLSVSSGTTLYGNGSNGGSTRNTGQGFINTQVSPIPAANSTTNTFGNLEVYIPNYTSSNFKSLIIDAVGENNSSTMDYAVTDLIAGLYRSTTTITQFQFFSIFGNFAQYSTFSLYGITKG